MSAQSAEWIRFQAPGLRDHVFLGWSRSVFAVRDRLTGREVQSGASIRFAMEMAMDFFPVRTTASGWRGMVRAQKKGEASGTKKVVIPRESDWHKSTPQEGIVLEIESDENEAVTSTRVMRRGDRMQKGDAVQLTTAAAASALTQYFRRQGTNAYATLILLGMVGPLCIGEWWGRRDGLDNTASYPTPAAC